MWDLVKRFNIWVIEILESGNREDEVDGIVLEMKKVNFVEEVLLIWGKFMLYWNG